MVISGAASTVVQAFTSIGRVFSHMDAEGLLASGLFDRVKDFDLFAGCDAATLKTMLADANWFGLPGGMDLDREGENDEAIFIVLSGRLAVRVEDEKGGLRIVAHIQAGETVGEMSLITGDAHGARLTARRDTELLRLSKEAFQRFIARDPKVMTNLTRLIIRRLRATTARAAALMRPKTFALVPLEPGANAMAFGAMLTEALKGMGLSVASFDPSHREEPGENQYNAEIRNDLTIYIGDEVGSAWTQHCLRQADRVLLLTRAGAAPTSRGWRG